MEDGYWTRLWQAICGQEREISGAVGSVSTEATDLRSRIRQLELELQDRDALIERMRGEYSDLQREKEQAVTTSGSEQVQDLFRRLTAPLANLAALAQMVRAGQEVPVEELVSAVGDVQKKLQREGLESIGRVDESVPFDTAQHQPLNSFSGSAGTPVSIRIPGYRMGETILLKAYVDDGEE